MKDITYCVSKECPKADKCQRHWSNSLPVGVIASMSDFYEKGKKCKYEADLDTP